MNIYLVLNFLFIYFLKSWSWSSHAFPGYHRVALWATDTFVPLFHPVEAPFLVACVFRTLLFLFKCRPWIFFIFNFIVLFLRGE